LDPQTGSTRESTPMNTTRILIPHDFTEASRQALRYAHLLAGLGRHELHLLHVVPDARYEPWARDVEDLDLDALTEDWVRDAGIRLHATTNELLPPGNALTAIRLGTAPEQIVAYAAEQGIDMIVLGAHRDLRSSEWLRGSVAERVVRKATCAVLTVPGGGRDVLPIDESPAASAVPCACAQAARDAAPAPSIRSLLIPFDFSPSAENALQQGLALAREHGATAHVLYVYDPPWTRNAAYAAPPAHITEQLRYRAEQKLARDIGRHYRPLVDVRPVVRVGDPYVEIVHYAGEIRAGLIVAGTHSRHTIGRLPLGSVAQKVLRRAPCPIVTVNDEAARIARTAGSAASARAAAMIAL
jgi:nucleotide-binding universal stress UspA family protein